MKRSRGYTHTHTLPEGERAEALRGSQRDSNSVYILVFKDESGKVQKRVNSIFNISKP